MIVWNKSEMIILPLMLLFILLITIILGLLLKNKSQKIKSLPLLVLSIIVLVLEITKQIENIVDGFSWWAIPLHYCSLFVFFFPLAQFGNEKLKTIFKPVAFTTATCMFLLFYFQPSNIIGSACDNVFDSFSSFHTFTFHHLIILYFTLSISLSNYKPQKNDFKYLLIVMFCYTIIGITASHLTNTNYCNFLYSNISFMESLRVNCGQIIYSISMMIVLSIGTSLVNFGYYKLYKVLYKNK